MDDGNIFELWYDSPIYKCVVATGCFFFFFFSSSGGWGKIKL